MKDEAMKRYQISYKNISADIINITGEKKKLFYPSLGH